MIEINIGIRAHDMKTRPIEELVEAISKKGLSSVQLALAKSFPNINTGLGHLSPGLAQYIGNEFKKHNVQIAVLGCYFNMIHPDPVERKAGIDRFKEHIRFARDFGCSLVATETGNVNADIFYDERNFEEQPFQEVVKTMRELVEEAEKFGVLVGVEAGVNHPIYSPQTMKRLIDEVHSNHLQVIFDPVNYLTVDTYQNQDEIFQEAFELYGDRIVIIHAKDCMVEEGQLKPIALGKGIINYEGIIKWLKENKPYIHMLMEETKEPFVEEGIDFLKRIYKQ